MCRLPYLKMKIIYGGMCRICSVLCQLIVSQLIGICVLPIVLVIFIVHHLIIRTCFSVYLLVRFKGKMKLVNHGREAMFGYTSEGNTRNIVIALDCQPLPVKEDKKKWILGIVNKKVGNTRPYDKLRWIFTRHLGYFCWQYDANFNVDNHMFTLPGKEPVDREALLSLITEYGNDMPDDHPQWQFIFIPRYINENGNESEVTIIRAHHSILDGLSFVTFMSHALGSLAPDSDDQAMNRPCPENFPFIINPINYCMPLKYRLMFNLNCCLFGFYHLVKTVTSNTEHWKLRNRFPQVKHHDFSELIDLKTVKIVREACGVSAASVVSFCFFKALEVVAGDRMPENLKIGNTLAILPYPDEFFHNRFTMMTVPLKRCSYVGRLEQLKAYHQECNKSLQGPEYYLYYWFFQFYGKLPAVLLKYTLKKARFSFFFTILPFAGKQVAALNYRVTDVIGWPPHTTNAGIGFTSVGYCGKMRLGATADSSWLTKDELQQAVRLTVKEIKMLAHESSYVQV